MELDLALASCALTLQCMYHIREFCSIHTSNSLLKRYIILFLILLAGNAGLGVVKSISSIDDIGSAFYDTVRYISLVAAGVTIFVMWNMCAAILHSNAFRYAIVCASSGSLFIYLSIITTVTSNNIVPVLFCSVVAVNMLIVLLIYSFLYLCKAVVPGIFGIFLLLITLCVVEAGYGIRVLSIEPVTLSCMLFCVSLYMILYTLRSLLTKERGFEAENIRDRHIDYAVHKALNKMC